jgi:hypothetical protein
MRVPKRSGHCLSADATWKLGFDCESLISSVDSVEKRISLSSVLSRVV